MNVLDEIFAKLRMVSTTQSEHLHVVLKGHFEHPGRDNMIGDQWTTAAVAGSEEMLRAIHSFYEEQISALLKDAHVVYLNWLRGGINCDAVLDKAGLLIADSDGELARLRRLEKRVYALSSAMRSLPECPPIDVILLLVDSGYALTIDTDIDVRGRRLQRTYGLDAIPPKAEYQWAAGLWSLIRDAVIEAKRALADNAPAPRYVALIHKDLDSAFGVQFPDLPGCISGGHTWEETMRMAREALAAHIDFLERDGDPVPPPRTIAQIMESTDPDTIEARTGAVLVEIEHRPECLPAGRLVEVQ
jgi:predicted RNase H-like HicB family nuclease